MARVPAVKAAELHPLLKGHWGALRTRLRLAFSAAVHWASRSARNEPRGIGGQQAMACVTTVLSCALAVVASCASSSVSIGADWRCITHHGKDYGVELLMLPVAKLDRAPLAQPWQHDARMGRLARLHTPSLELHLVTPARKRGFELIEHCLHCTRLRCQLTRQSRICHPCPPAQAEGARPVESRLERATKPLACARRRAEAAEPLRMAPGTTVAQQGGAVFGSSEMAEDTSWFLQPTTCETRALCACAGGGRRRGGDEKVVVAAVALARTVEDSWLFVTARTRMLGGQPRSKLDARHTATHQRSRARHAWRPGDDELRGRHRRHAKPPLEALAVRLVITGEQLQAVQALPPGHLGEAQVYRMACLTVTEATQEGVGDGAERARAAAGVYEDARAAGEEEPTSVCSVESQSCAGRRG